MSEIKKPWVAINGMTGTLVKRFKTPEKLAKYLFTPRSFGDAALIAPASLYVIGARVDAENEDGSLDLTPIEWQS